MASDAEQQRSDRILNFIVSKGLQGCPVCGQGQFSVGPEHVIISTPDPAPVEGAPVEGTLVEGTAVVPVMCSNCGHMLLFGTRVLPNQGE
jgi:hypothetical protein